MIAPLEVIRGVHSPPRQWVLVLRISSTAVLKAFGARVSRPASPIGAERSPEAMASLLAATAQKVEAMEAVRVPVVQMRASVVRALVVPLLGDD